MKYHRMTHYRALHNKEYKFEKLPSLKGWDVYPEEASDIHSALDDYAKSVIRIAMSEIVADFGPYGITVSFSNDYTRGIEISYEDCIKAMVESAHEYDKDDTYDPDQCSLNCKITELEEALKLLKSFKK